MNEHFNSSKAAFSDRHSLIRQILFSSFMSYSNGSQLAFCLFKPYTSKSKKNDTKTSIRRVFILEDFKLSFKDYFRLSTLQILFILLSYNLFEFSTFFFGWHPIDIYFIIKWEFPLFRWNSFASWHGVWYCETKYAWVLIFNTELLPRCYKNISFNLKQTSMNTISDCQAKNHRMHFVWFSSIRLWSSSN